jgi:hypothetical protein
MPFSTTAEFRTAVKSWSKRSELSDAEIDDFTRLFEAEFFGDPEIRLREMETTDDAFAVADRITALPTGFLELRSIQVISSPSYPLKLITPQSAAEAYNYATAANGLSYLIEGNNLRIEPLPAPITLRIGYFAALTTITGGSANWLLTNWPNAYLFGTLRYTAPYIGNDERIPMWEEWYQRTRALIIAADRKARRSGSQPGMRLRSTP